MFHPYLGDRAKEVVFGELTGTAASMTLNVLFHPVVSAMLKFLGGFGLTYFSMKRTDPTGTIMWQAGLRMITSTLEQVSYAEQASKIVEGAKAIASGMGREVVLSDWIKEAMAKMHSAPAPMAYTARTVASGGEQMGVFKVANVKEEKPVYVPVV